MTALRRSVEPLPAWAGCKWLSRCQGADQVRAHWSTLGLWCKPLWGALELPKLSRRHPCAGCPLVTTSQQEVA
jgi:hypothetical protein